MVHAKLTDFYSYFISQLILVLPTLSLLTLSRPNTKILTPHETCRVLHTKNRSPTKRVGSSTQRTGAARFACRVLHTKNRSCTFRVSGPPHKEPEPHETCRVLHTKNRSRTFRVSGPPHKEPEPHISRDI